MNKASEEFHTAGIARFALLHGLTFEQAKVRYWKLPSRKRRTLARTAIRILEGKSNG